MKTSLDPCFERLGRIEEFLPLVLARNKNLLSQMQKIDEQIQRCAQWFNECRQLIGRYSIQVPLRRIEEFLEQNRVRFDRKGEKANLQLSFFKHLLSQTEIYRTALENIRRIIDGMKQSNDRTAPLNYDWIDDQFRQSNDNFEVRH